MRNFLISLVLFLWALLGYKMCTDYNSCCAEEVVISETPVAPVAIQDPIICPKVICFEKNSCAPIFGSAWPSYRDSVISTIGSNQKLLITGYSSPSERNNSTFDNLGLCRADTIRRAVLAHMNNEDVKMAGQLRVGQQSSSQGYSSEMLSFRVIGDDVEVNSSTLIYFPFNSTNKLADSSVETYLKQVATQVKKSGQKVRLTGHTDNQGNEAYNMNLGRKRANIIKNFLISQGLPTSQIITISKGETEPVTSNTTEQGRAKNRRTEMLITN